MSELDDLKAAAKREALQRYMRDGTIDAFCRHDGEDPWVRKALNDFAESLDQARGETPVTCEKCGSARLEIRQVQADERPAREVRWCQDCGAMMPYYDQAREKKMVSAFQILEGQGEGKT